MTEDQLKYVRQYLHRLTYATATIGVVLAILLYMTWALSNTTNDSLCDFKKDLRGRISFSENYLKIYPQGTKAVPVGIIKINLQAQQNTLKALSNLNC